MFSLEIECDPEDRDLLIAELWEQQSAGIVELSPRNVRAFFEDGADLDELQRLFPGSAFRREEQRDWVKSARDLLQPMEVGRRFYLVPEWRDDPAPAGRFRIAACTLSARSARAASLTWSHFVSTISWLTAASPSESRMAPSTSFKPCRASMSR
jgi:hypothetical protein